MENKVCGLGEEKLEELLKKWQEKLGLREFDLKIKIVDFTRTDYRQSGDFCVDLEKKTGEILLTREPFLINQKTLELEEEHTILHELVHVLLWEMDEYAEKMIVGKCGESSGEHDEYLGKLENVVEKLTNLFWEQYGK